MLITLFKFTKNDCEDCGLIPLSKGLYLHHSINFLINRKLESLDYGLKSTAFWRGLLEKLDSVYWLDTQNNKIVNDKNLEKIFQHTTNLESKVWVPKFIPSTNTIPYELRHDFDEVAHYRGHKYYLSFSGISRQCVILGILDYRKTCNYTELKAMCQPEHELQGAHPIITTILLEHNKVITGGVHSLKLNDYMNRLHMSINPEKKSPYKDEEHLKVKVYNRKLMFSTGEALPVQTINELRTTTGKAFNEEELLFYNLFSIVRRIKNNKYIIRSDSLADRIIVNVNGKNMTLSLSLKNITGDEKWKITKRFITLIDYMTMFGYDYNLLDFRMSDKITIINTKLLLTLLSSGGQELDYENYPYSHSTGISVELDRDEKELPLLWGVKLNKSGSLVGALEFDSTRKNTYKLKILSKRKDTETYLV